MLNRFSVSAILKIFPDKNVIIVDWGKLNGNGQKVNDITIITMYTVAAANVNTTGEEVSRFLRELKNQLKIESPAQGVHFIGHSLGGHGTLN